MKDIPIIGRTLLVLATCAMLSLDVFATPTTPSWWTNSQTKFLDAGYNNTENHYPVNAGQLKNAVTAAHAYLDIMLVRGAGAQLTELQDSLGNFDNYAPTTVGQLKHACDLIYTRLWQGGYDPRPFLQSQGVSSSLFTGQTPPYVPFDRNAPDEENSRMVTVGALKIALSFDLGAVGTPTDVNANGLPDWWEDKALAGLSSADRSPNADPDGDGVTNLDEYLQGTDPQGVDYQAVTVTVHQPAGDPIELIMDVVTQNYSNDSYGTAPFSQTLYFPHGQEHINVAIGGQPGGSSGTYSVSFSPQGGAFKEWVMTKNSDLLSGSWPGSGGLKSWDFKIPANLVVDVNRDKTFDDDPNSVDQQLENMKAWSGSISPDQKFNSHGALILANLDNDEQNMTTATPTIPSGDSIRFYHDGRDLHATDEDFHIRTGEDKKVPFVLPTQPAIFPDIHTFKITQLGFLQPQYRVYLKVLEIDDLKSFHLFKEVALNETAIWGEFGGTGATKTWTDGDANPNDIEITSYLKQGGVYQSEHTFGIEAMLYRGAPYKEDQNGNVVEFDGFLELAVEVRDSNGTTVLGEADQATISLGRRAAFPGAGGFGRWAKGGRHGEVFIVNNLNDTTTAPTGNTGSLRQAIKYRNKDHNNRLIPRTIVFDTSGYITLSDKVNVKDGLLTIAGQSAPMEGLMIRGAGLYVTGQQRTPAGNSDGWKLAQANHVQVRYLRVRAYDEGIAENEDSNEDAFRVDKASNVIVDHCSISWGKDGTLDLTAGDNADQDNPDQSVTVQWCRIAEAWPEHSKMNLNTSKFGARFSLHHNFLVHGDTRMPRFGQWEDAVVFGEDTYTEASQNADRHGVLVDFRNNVSYNWGDRSSGETASQIDGFIRYQLIENVYKTGVSSDNDWAHDESSNDSDHETQSFLDGTNRMNGTKWTPAWAKVDDFNMAGSFFQTSAFYVEKVDTDIVWVAGNNYKEDVLKYSGEHRWPDAVDRRVVTDMTVSPLVSTIPTDAVQGAASAVTNANQKETEYFGDTGNGYTSAPSSDWWGWPVINGSVAPKNRPSGFDSDQDGMSDAWEANAAKWLPSVSDLEPNKDEDRDGWTNLEEYLNQTNPLLPNDPMSWKTTHIKGELN